ncbi:replication-associated recombination protein A [Mycoplasma sp. AC157]
MNKKLDFKKFKPETLDEIIGQEHIKFLLNRVIELKNRTSFIFYGESGIGKTSVANVLALNLNLKYTTFNATIENKDSLLEKIKNNDILIIDEIHRLNKDKQDLLLSYLEKDEIIIYATTTENPYFKINPAIRSRMQILKFNKPSLEEIINFFHLKNLILPKEIIEKIIFLSNFDIRTIFRNLDFVLTLSKNDLLSEEIVEKLLPNVNFYSDKNADSHYNNLSAFHKSLRGSDPDAALYYGMLIIKSGDFDGLYRRMLCVAYEDIGLAHPNISLKVMAAINSAERLGMPEARLPLSTIIIELALSPKSNSTYQAMQKVSKLIDNGKIYEIPDHLKDSHYKSAKKFNHGVNYLYPHDFLNNYVDQQYLPSEIKNNKFFEFGNNKNEQKLKEYLNKIKEK